MTYTATHLSTGLKLESLESRRLMAADVVLEHGVLKVIGTPASDIIEICESGNWEVASLRVSIKNSQTGEIVITKSVTQEAVQLLVVDGLAGNDTIVCTIAKPAFINAGGGDDSIEVKSKYALVDGGAGIDNLKGTAALDCMYESVGVETIFGKSASAWAVIQDAGGNSRYGAEETVVWVRDWNLDWVDGENCPWGGDRHEEWEVREQREILRWYSNPHDAFFNLPSGIQKSQSNSATETGGDYENAWG